MLIERTALSRVLSNIVINTTKRLVITGWTIIFAFFWAWLTNPN